MLPFGHLSAGYLTTRAVLSALHNSLPQDNQTFFIAFGMTVSFIPDLDVFYIFYKTGRPVTHDEKFNHRKFFTHAPLLHLFIALIGLAAALITRSENLAILSALYLSGTWTHFFLDSFSYGIMWLWPFDKKIYSFRDRLKDFEISNSSFFGYWLEFLRLYSKTFTFYLEVIVIASAIYLWLR